MKVLVTGGAGFIGSHFVRHILTREPQWQVVNLDKLTYAGNLANLADVADNPRYGFVHGDICNGDLVREVVQGCDAVVNFAAESHIDRSIADPSDFVMTDMYGTYVLLEAVRELDIGLFVQVSTSEVYGTAGEIPPREDSPLMPQSPYAASKAGADRLAWSYFSTYGTPVVITRCVNNYGPNQYPEKLIPLFVTNAIEGKPMPIYGDGQNTREWIAAEDHCGALHALLTAGEVEGETFNIGTGRELSVIQVADIILDELGKDESLKHFVPDRPGHVQRIALNSDRIREQVGFEPQIGWKEGLRATVKWYAENEGWWMTIKSGEYRRYYQQQYAEGLRGGAASVREGEKA